MAFSTNSHPLLWVPTYSGLLWGVSSDPVITILDRAVHDSRRVFNWLSSAFTCFHMHLLLMIILSYILVSIIISILQMELGVRQSK